MRDFASDEGGKARWESTVCPMLHQHCQEKDKRVHVKRTTQRLCRAFKSRKGQSLVEYALILALIAVVAITVLRGLGRHVNNTLSTVNANLP